MKQKLENCPYHDIQPDTEIKIYREAQHKTYIDLTGKQKRYNLKRLQDYICFCPECRREIDENDILSKKLISKLNLGYKCRSKNSRSEAYKIWNKTCQDIIIQKFNTAVLGI